VNAATGEARSESGELGDCRAGKREIEPGCILFANQKFANGGTVYAHIVRASGNALRRTVKLVTRTSTSGVLIVTATTMIVTD
jgi:hypothetical protein